MTTNEILKPARSKRARSAVTEKDTASETAGTPTADTTEKKTRAKTKSTTKSSRPRKTAQVSDSVDSIESFDSPVAPDAPGTLNSMEQPKQLKGLQAELIELMEQANRPIKPDEILKIGHMPRKQKINVQNELRELVADGVAVRLSGGYYFPASKLVKKRGTLQVQRAGMGFVLPDRADGSAVRSAKKDKQDIYVHPEHLGEAWNGDRVEVLILPGRQGRRPEGQVVAVLERARKEFLVRVLHGMGRDMPDQYMAVPLDQRLNIALLVDAENLRHNLDKDGTDQNRWNDNGTLKPNSLLLVKLGEHLKDEHAKLWAAEAIELFNEQDDIKVQERLVKANNNIPVEFPAPVLQEAETLPDHPDLEDFKGRQDLQNLGFVTIDGADSKDFDDAILVNKTDSGFCLQVAIADVAHYVRPGSQLDNEARERGNSCYFPFSVEPMLPEALSNNLCSLNPQVPRLVMLAKIFFDRKGNVTGSEFANAVIKSQARLTYDQVFAALKDPGEDGNAEAVASIEALSPKGTPDIMLMLREAKELALLLKAKRKANGSLDFDLPEPKAVIDSEGKLVDLAKREQNFANQLIEECMLAANEAVASFLHARNMPVLFRNHAEPDQDKLDALFNVIAGTELGLKLPAQFFKSPGAAGIATLLKTAKGSPQEFITSRLVLRSMMQARYSPVLEGHYGLASECYCHFTSPIRRYADLLVHRSLKAALHSPDASDLPDLETLNDIADHINGTERSAIDAEREIFKRLAVLLLRDKVGEVYHGVVSGVTDFGLFVELGETVAEGMLRVATLNDDYYDYVQDRHELRGSRHGRVFRLGMPLTVRIFEVNSERLEITLELIEDGDAAAAPGKRGRAASSKRSTRDGSGKADVRLSSLDAPRKKGKPAAKKSGSAKASGKAADKVSGKVAGKSDKKRVSKAKA